MAGKFNISEVDSDPFYDGNENYYEETDSLYTVLTVFMEVTEVIKLLIYLCVVAADTFLIIIICKTKKLKTKLNLFIVHYAVFNIISIVASPIFHITITLTNSRRYLFSNVFCVINEVESVSILFSHLLALGLALEWLFSVFHSSLGKYLRNIRKYLIYLLYFPGIMTFAITLSICFKHQWIVRHMILRIVFVNICIFLGICNYFSNKNIALKDSKKYALTISNVMILSWVPMYIYHEIINFNRYSTTLDFICFFTLFIPECLAYGSPIGIIVLLGILNKNFQMAYDKAFRRNVQNYSNDAGDSDESEENDNEKHDDIVDDYENAAIL